MQTTNLPQQPRRRAQTTPAPRYWRDASRFARNTLLVPLTSSEIGTPSRKSQKSGAGVKNGGASDYWKWPLVAIKKASHPCGASVSGWRGCLVWSKLQEAGRWRTPRFYYKRKVRHLGNAFLF